MADNQNSNIPRRMGRSKQREVMKPNLLGIYTVNFSLCVVHVYKRTYKDQIDHYKKERELNYAKVYVKTKIVKSFVQ